MPLPLLKKPNPQNHFNYKIAKKENRNLEIYAIVADRQSRYKIETFFLKKLNCKMFRGRNGLACPD